MIFCDLENFRYSLRECCPSSDYAEVNFEDFHKSLFKIVVNSIGLQNQNPLLIRAYLYTGEYSDAQINQAKTHLGYLPSDQADLRLKITGLERKLQTTTDYYQKEKIRKEIEHFKRGIVSPERIENLKFEIEKAKVRQKAQSEVFNSLSRINFLELRAKPLKYSRKDLRFIQKGTDVQLAVDLVNFAHFNNFEVAIVCSGDLDLLESCKQIKSLGKIVVLVSHSNQVSPIMVKESDFYLNLSTIDQQTLKELVISKGGQVPVVDDQE